VALSDPRALFGALPLRLLHMQYSLLSRLRVMRFFAFCVVLRVLYRHADTSSLNMLKMASTFKQQKPAKKRNKIYFDEEQKKPLQAPNASKEDAIKVNNNHLHKTSDSADPTAAEMAVPRSRGTFDSTVLVRPYGPNCCKVPLKCPRWRY
jgi:hypothetical protein